MRLIKVLIGFALMFLFLSACESQPGKPETFSNIYKEDLSKVDKITIKWTYWRIADNNRSRTNPAMD